MAKKLSEEDRNELMGDDDQPHVPTPPDPWALMARMVEAMERLTSRQQEGDGEATKLAQILAPALERLAESNIAGAKLITDETRRAHRPSNEVVHQRSVFNRRGVLLREQNPDGVSGPVKPPLKCPMLIPWLAEWESLTREEVELLNLLEPGEYVLKRVDNSKIKLTIQVEYREDMVTATRLLMNHETAFNNDNKNLIPQLADMLRQILHQHSVPVMQQAAAVMTDEEEEALIEAGQIVVSV